MKKFSLTWALLAVAVAATAQPVQRILYVAAHPDDENTRLIAHWSRAEGREVAYVSLTRGEGGQNLIGPELGPALGAIREAELRAARQIDGATQYFTSAPDFGFSKNPEETFSIWDREKILGELFALAAEFRPDISVTRFPYGLSDAGTRSFCTAAARPQVQRGLGSARRILEYFDLVGQGP